MSRYAAPGRPPGMPSWAAPPPIPRGDRRMGKRVPTAQLAVTVHYLVPRCRRWHQDLAVAVDGFVADMSLTGVGVLVPRDRSLVVGAVVDLEIRGAFGEAVIRRISYITDADRAHYGMEYGHLSADFRDLVGELVAGTHKEFDWQWIGSGVSEAEAASWA